MLTRAQYIERVKVKLEEISPFDEPENFIAESGSAASAVKPIKSYIDNSIDEAARNCLQALPLSLLHGDVKKVSSTGAAPGVIEMHVDGLGVGRFGLADTIRPIRFRHSALKRDITAFITTEDSLYLLQQNLYTRGGTAKPVAVWSSDLWFPMAEDSDESESEGEKIGMEIYSFPREYNETVDTTSVLLGIDTAKAVQTIQSPIEDFIVLECAAMVSDILGNANAAQTLRAESAMKLAAVLQ